MSHLTHREALDVLEHQRLTLGFAENSKRCSHSDTNLIIRRFARNRRNQRNNIVSRNGRTPPMIYQAPPCHSPQPRDRHLVAPSRIEQTNRSRVSIGCEILSQRMVSANTKRQEPIHDRQRLLIHLTEPDNIGFLATHCRLHHLPTRFTTPNPSPPTKKFFTTQHAQPTEPHKDRHYTCLPRPAASTNRDCRGWRPQD